MSDISLSGLAKRLDRLEGRSDKGFGDLVHALAERVERLETVAYENVQIGSELSKRVERLEDQWEHLTADKEEGTSEDTPKPPSEEGTVTEVPTAGKAEKATKKVGKTNG